jgi:hypothetical protein
MATRVDEILDAPGQVQIDNLVLISFRKQSFLNLTDYLVELILNESILDYTVSGEIVLSDSRNLINAFNMVGEEYISLTIRTPTLSSDRSISKIFKVYALKDKMYAKDGSTLIYTLSFVSLETFQDLLNPIYRSFSGKPEAIVKQIYEDYLITNRNIQISGEPAADVKTPLTFFGETANTIKFVSPGWSPVKCINWVSSKTLPANEKSANFLFWETTKGFYFGNLETILNKPQVASIGTYMYSASSITTMDEEGLRDAKFMYNIRSLVFDRTFDQLKNHLDGYIANRIIDVDVVNKKFENVDYDHGKSFKNYSHLEKDQPVPIFDENTPRNPTTCLDINYSCPGLHTGFENNFSERVKNIWGNRRSNLLELHNFKMEIMIPGRTDIEAGQTIYIEFPKKDGGALTMEDKNTYEVDPMYSGYYLITHLAHKINPRTHYTSLVLTKDSFSYKAMR